MKLIFLIFLSAFTCFNNFEHFYNATSDKVSFQFDFKLQFPRIWFGLAFNDAIKPSMNGSQLVLFFFDIINNTISIRTGFLPDYGPPLLDNGLRVTSDLRARVTDGVMFIRFDINNIVSTVRNFTFDNCYRYAFAHGNLTIRNIMRRHMDKPEFSQYCVRFAFPLNISHNQTTPIDSVDKLGSSSTGMIESNLTSTSTPSGITYITKTTEQTRRLNSTLTTSLNGKSSAFLIQNDRTLSVSLAIFGVFFICKINFYKFY